MRRFEGILLDIDGTLVDSNDAHARSWVETLAEFGREVAYDEVRRRIGMGGDKLLPAVTGISAESPEGKKISKRRQELFKEKYLPTLKPTPGAEDLLARLHDEGLTMVVATSAQDDELKGLLKVCGAERYIQAKTSSDDADNSKPDPDIVHAALGRIKLPADRVVMLGDTPYDVEAAGRAGVAVISFRCGGWDDKGLKGALAVYADPADLLTHLDASPLAGVSEAAAR